MKVDAVKDKVAIIGMGCTKFGENWNNSAEDMIDEFTKSSYQLERLKKSLLQNLITGKVRLKTEAVK